MTLRGFSAALDERELPSAGGEARAPGQVHADGGRRRSASTGEAPTRREWLFDKERPGRPSTFATRQALGSLTSAALVIEQQLDLIEMLIAVGPGVREPGTMRESLRTLEGMKDELGKCVADLVKACGDAP
jgi:hypothetical protein